MVKLEGKKIILGVSGSIAIYKTLELIRLFVKSDAEVFVVMSEEAKRFITPLTFEAISQNKVLHKDSESWADGTNHIDIREHSDLFLIAPASANTISKIANGICDNLLLQSILAYDKQILLAPAANTKMIQNPFVQENIKKLKSAGVQIISPKVSLLSCGEFGEGAMANVEDIYYACARELLKTTFWSDKKVVVTGGGTSEKIDDFRFITNASSGKMASNLALALFLKGANIKLITSKNPIPLPSYIDVLHFDTSAELKELIDRSSGEYLFMSAAVADFVNSEPKKGKIKKEDRETLDIKLTKNIDILKNTKFNGQKIGFKAESDRARGLESAKRMLREKNLKAVCLNYIDDKHGFGDDNQEIIYIDDKGETSLFSKHKLELAFEILETISKGS